jgi:hypothetical protein
MKFGFKIHLDDLAEKLIEKGFSSQDTDSDDFIDRLVEMLDSEYDFLTALGEEMQKIEESDISPRNKAEYDESIGEF